MQRTVVLINAACEEESARSRRWPRDQVGGGVELEGLDPSLRAALAPHAATLEALHRAHGRLYGYGGLLSLCGAALLPALVAREAPLGAWQVALLVGLALLMGLGGVRVAAQAQARRLRDRAILHCHQTQTSPEALLALARRGHPRWFFFCALWDDWTPPQNP
jgi:hypothetical protein